MAKNSRWFGVVRRKFLRSSARPSETNIVLHTHNTTFSHEQQPPPPPSPPPPSTTSTIVNDHVCDGSSVNKIAAATIIQACFRRHLAQRAYKALKSLVKLQAVVRGAYVRRQSRIALECMHALARLQVVVRARQLQLLASNPSYS